MILQTKRIGTDRVMFMCKDIKLEMVISLLLLLAAISYSFFMNDVLYRNISK